MLITFSDETTGLLKEKLPYDQLVWSENTLDLASIKKLKGCCTELVQDCLKLIQELDTFKLEKENYALGEINTLIESLKHYKSSCEYYPRIKDFLNLAPDYSGETAAFIIIISAIISTAFPPLAIIPLIIFSWILMDLFFNNKEAADILKKILFTAENKLSTIKKANEILNPKRTLSQATAAQTQQSLMAATPSTSRNYSPTLYGATADRSETRSINSASTSFNSTR